MKEFFNLLINFLLAPLMCSYIISSILMVPVYMQLEKYLNIPKKNTKAIIDKKGEGLDSLPDLQIIETENEDYKNLTKALISTQWIYTVLFFLLFLYLKNFEIIIKPIK